MRGTQGWAWVAALGAWSALGHAQTVHSKLQPPTAARIKSVLTTGRGGSGSAFGIAINGRQFAYDSGDEQCDGAYEVGQDSVRGACTVTTGVGWDDRRGAPAREESFERSFAWKVEAVANDLVVYRDDRERFCWTVENQRGGCGTLIEVIPGAKDQALFNAVRGQLASEESLTVFEGAPARAPRPVTEVLFSAGSEDAAKAIAKALEPTTGPVVVKPWTGAGLLADVAVVVGAAKAR